MPGRGLFLAGFLIILADLRFEGVDFIADPVGWVLVLVALLGLTRQHGGFLLATWSAVAGTVVSLGTVLSPPASLVTDLESVATTGVVFGTCTALCALATSHRDRQAANVIRWLELGITVIALVVSALAGDEEVAVEGAAVAPFVLLFVAVFAVVIWFLVLVWRVDLRAAQARSAGGST